jgi:hypothetical protein
LTVQKRFRRRAQRALAALAITVVSIGTLSAPQASAHNTTLHGEWHYFGDAGCSEYVEHGVNLYAYAFAATRNGSCDFATKADVFYPYLQHSGYQNDYAFSAYNNTYPTLSHHFACSQGGFGTYFCDEFELIN